MIPGVNGILTEDLEVESLPSKNYMMHIDRNRISGFCDKQDAVKQAIYKILNTERYQYIIYSWNYGIQLTFMVNQSHMCVLNWKEESLMPFQLMTESFHVKDLILTSVRRELWL